jgi:hypothetical protein
LTSALSAAAGGFLIKKQQQQQRQRFDLIPIAPLLLRDPIKMPPD